MSYHITVNKVLLPLVFSVMALSLIASPAFAQITITPGSVLSIEPKSPFIHKINPDTGDTISSVEITLDGTFPSDLTVNGGTGIAHNPADGKTYALLKVTEGEESSGLDRHLATINLQTGVATLVGDTGVEKIANLAFNPGTLYSLGSDGLSTISTADGSVTNLCELVFFSGTGLAYNPDDGFLYFTTDGEFQRIDSIPANPDDLCNVTDIPLSDFPGKPSALTFFNSFLIVDFFDALSFIANNNEVTFIDILDESSRGLTVVIPVGVIGGELIPLDTTALLLAGVQSVSMWMIPVILAGAGIGVFVIKRRN